MIFLIVYGVSYLLALFFLIKEVMEKDFITAKDLIQSLIISFLSPVVLIFVLRETIDSLDTTIIWKKKD